MSPAAFIDVNIPIYAAGRPHPLKAPCARILVLAAGYSANAVTNAEVLQELMHHYLAVRQWGQGAVAFRRFTQMLRDRIEPIYAGDVERAAELAATFPELGGRDLLHAAVMQRLGVAHIISADRGFDRLPGVQRLDPAELDRWQQLVFA